MGEPTPPQTSKPGSSPALGAILVGLLKEIVDTLMPAFVVALLINLFLAQGTSVHGQSMEPNLHTDQRLIVEKVSYRLHAPRRGDIVVIDIDRYDIPLIKRVIGLLGETVGIRDNQVYINGELLQEDYLTDVRQRNHGPIEVAPDHVFVMGDNRSASNDSRYFGPVPIARVLGRAWFSYWPLDELHVIQ